MPYVFQEHFVPMVNIYFVISMKDIHNINMLQKLALTYQVMLSRLNDNDPSIGFE
jgi:hypothetical protein